MEHKRYTIQHSKSSYDSSFSVYGWSTYPRHSVLAGQDRKVFIDSYDTLAEAQAAYPQATMSSKWIEPQVSLNHLPGEGDGSNDY